MVECCISLILFLFLFLLRFFVLRLEHVEAVKAFGAAELSLTFLRLNCGVNDDFKMYMALTCVKTMKFDALGR